MKTRILVLILLLISIPLTACSSINQIFNPVMATPTATLTPMITPTSLPTLTPTPPPSVAIVNGIYIWQEDIDLTKANIASAHMETSGKTLSEAELEQEALQTLIDETIFQSAAINQGINLKEEALTARIQKLIEDAGGEDAFHLWMDKNNYTEASFRRALSREADAAALRENIFAEKLSNVDQIHAYQILTTTRSEADAIKTKLDLGLSFLDLAKSNDTITGGNLDWVARGILVYPQLEEALFALQPGTYTDIIETDIGFHILYAAERSTEHELSLQTRQILEHKALADWLSEEKSTADIIYLKQ